MRKGQAAMDFIVTYGWAIFSVIVIIGILAFFDILSPEKFASEECYFPEVGIKCVSHQVSPGFVNLALLNEKPTQITINSIQVNDCMQDISKSLPIAAQDDFQVSCTTGEVDEKFKGKTTIFYTEVATGFAKTSEGIIKTKIE